MLETIADLEQAMGGLRFKSPRYLHQIKNLERMVFDNRATQLENVILKDPRFAAYAVQTQRIYNDYEVHDEYKSRNQLLETIEQFGLPTQSGLTGSLLDVSPPIKRTYQYAFMEAKLGSLGKGSRYCHIGCGSFPETLMAMRTYLGTVGEVTGIDLDERALSYGASFVEVFGMRGSIDFLHAPGDQVDYSRYSHIHMAVLVRPEDQVIERICQTASTEHTVTILLRSAYGLGRLIYEPIAAQTEANLVAHGFKSLKTLRGHAIMQTQLFRRSI